MGELVNRSGGGAFEGYYNNASATEARLRDGWYWSGDLAYRDEKGFFILRVAMPTGCVLIVKTLQLLHLKKSCADSLESSWLLSIQYPIHEQEIK